MTIEQAIQAALQHHQAGRLADAGNIYRQILTRQANHPDALHLLGVIAYQCGRGLEAVDLIGQAIAVEPNDPAYHCNLGEACRSLGRLEQAVAAYSRAIQLKSDYATAYSNLGNALKDMGKLDEALAAYSKAIQISPGYADAFNNLANVLKDQGKTDQAIAAYRKAIQLKPALAEAHSNLGGVLADLGNNNEAIVACQRAIQLKPAYGQAWNNLGTALNNLARHDEAIAAYNRAVQFSPDDAMARANLGNALNDAGRLDEALAACSRAIQLKPAYADAYNHLGNALRGQGKLSEAAAAFARALALHPGYVDAQSNLGSVLFEQGNLDEAIAAISKAIEMKPQFPEAYANLGIALIEQGKLDQAVAACNRAIQLKPTYADAYNNLGNALKDQGLLEEALACYRRAMALDPDDPTFHSNLARMLHFQPGCDAQTVLQEHRRWNQRFAEPLKRFIKSHGNTPDPDRRLKVGYVSPDLRIHPVARFLLPLLGQRDREKFEVFCYAEVRDPDAMTGRLRGLSDQWRSTVGLSDEQVAESIRRDEIDILVDLAMHTANNRLLVFARKPAPVQVAWLAYCSTTGLDTMDYRLTDPYLDPPGVGDACYSEQSIRLADTFWCYEPGMATPEAGAPPAMSSGQVTFGCLNNFCKVSAMTLAAWCQLLGEVPNSRLLLHARQGSHRQRVLDRMKQEGVDPSRVRFVGFVARPEYFRLYQEIDIGLDPFPCAGGTTTCDALWMGVPVVTMSGPTAVARAGVTLLSNIAMTELIAYSEDVYVQLATRLAADLPRLADIRASLRQRMRQSPLMNAPRFARNVEAAYHQMWRTWCASR